MSYSLMAAGAQADDGRHDFDFLHGSWNVRNRRLARRLEASTDWREFEASVEVRPILHGLGNIDCFRTSAMPEYGVHEGCALRLFDPETRLWTIWWASTSHPGRLDEPLVGRFNGTRGQFFCDDTFEGRPIRIRFDWSHDSGDDARWEQAFSADEGETWELNWVMIFSREGAR